MTDRYGPNPNGPKLSKIRADFNKLRIAVRQEGTPEIQEAWDKVERWLGHVYQESEK